jgi:CheY-like chemotaxis protein
MVYGFAQQSGGHVTIESRPGEGTSVTILLPAQAPAPLEGRSGGEEAAAAPGHERVLVVEDEPQVLQFVSAQLTGLGYAVTAVSTGPDALELLRAERFDVLFSDVVLPKGLSGVELARRARAIRPELKVLLTSGYPEEAFEHHGRPDATTPLLKKPYRKTDLADSMRKLIEGG